MSAALRETPVVLGQLVSRNLEAVMVLKGGGG